MPGIRHAGIGRACRVRLDAPSRNQNGLPGRKRRKISTGKHWCVETHPTSSTHHRVTKTDCLAGNGAKYQPGNIGASRRTLRDRRKKLGASRRTLLVETVFLAAVFVLRVFRANYRRGFYSWWRRPKREPLRRWIFQLADVLFAAIHAPCVDPAD